MISNAYTYYISQYGHKINAKYDTHTKSQLKNSYGKVIKANSLAPTYKIDISEAAQKYAIDLKEHARQLSYIAKDLSDDQSGEMIFKKSAQSSNKEAVTATFIGDSSSPAISSFDIEVKQIATPQINTGNYLQPNAKLLAAGNYSFDLNINNLTYEFEFSIGENETNNNIQNKIARLINRSNIGLQASIQNDELGNSAISIKSDYTGITGIKPTIFNIESSNAELLNTLGLDRVTQYPSNALFSINGQENYSSTNEFTINNSFSISLNAPTGDAPATISLNTDSNSVLESINDLISGYNNLVSVATKDTSTSFEGNNRLKREFTNIAKAHKSSLESNGLHVEDDGSVSIDKDTVLKNSSEGNIGNIFKALNSFKKDMQTKADSIATNPMNYVNNKIVAYKNPHRPLSDPYNLSAYTGMMFSDYI